MLKSDLLVFSVASVVTWLMYYICLHVLFPHVSHSATVKTGIYPYLKTIRCTGLLPNMVKVTPLV